jgi:hypothetical protein
VRNNMEYYDPNESPNSLNWLAMSIDERLILVLNYHGENEVDLLEQDMNLHASIHVVVENQLAENTQYIPETLVALIQLGRTRHDALHDIGGVILEEKQGSGSFTSDQYLQKFQALVSDFQSEN